MEECGVPEIYFDERIAKGYDAASTDMFEPAVVDPAVDFLADLAGDGDALELGIGTGRIALPLRERGVPVHGIELPPAMAEQLRAESGAEEIGVTIGDFATTTVGRPSGSPTSSTTRSRAWPPRTRRWTASATWPPTSSRVAPS